MDPGALLQAGGVLAFAAVVYRQLEKLTRSFDELSKNMLLVLEQQKANSKAQEQMADDLRRIGFDVRLPSEVNQ